MLLAPLLYAEGFLCIVCIILCKLQEAVVNTVFFMLM